MKEDRTDRLGMLINRNTGIISMVPAYLLCFVTAMMLILDIALPSMSDSQYTVYPLAVRLISLAGIICMAACFGSELEKGMPRPGAEDYCFAAFAIWMLISTVLNGISHDAVFGMAFRYVGVYDLVIYIFIYRYCASRASDPKMKRLFFVLLMAVSIAIDAAFICNEVTGKIAAFNGKLEPSAIFFHGNHYGYFLVMAIAVSAGCLIYYRGRLAALGAVSLVINMGAMALNRSMGCLIATGTVLAVMIIASLVHGGLRRKKALVIAVTVIVLGSAALAVLKSFREDVFETIAEAMTILSGTNDIHAGNGRWGIWQYVADYIKVEPVWGYGCEGIAEIMKDYTLTTSPHNELLTYAAFFGIPASVFYFAAVAVSIAKGLKSRNDDGRAERAIAAYAAIAYLVSSLFGLAVFYTAPFMFIFLGLSSETNRSGN